MLVIVFASTTSAPICRNHSVSILKEPKWYSFIALKTIFIKFRETRLARVSKRFVSTNFPSDIAISSGGVLHVEAVSNCSMIDLFMSQFQGAG